VRGSVGEEELVVPAPGPHGDDAVRVARALRVDVSDLLDLATTLNPVAPDVSPLLVRHLDSIHRYPDERMATQAMAEALGVSSDRIVLTNGGAEAIALVAAVVERGWVNEPEFGLYKRHLKEVVPTGTVWRSNPNNPMGVLAATEESADVWDEAHYPLAAGAWTRGDLGSFTLGSLTKVFACPGLRAGYIVAPDPQLAAELSHRRPRWSLNSLAAAVLPELVERATLQRWKAAMEDLRAQLVDLLGAFGLRPLASDAPWVLVPNARGLRERLARQLVLVRDCRSFGLEGHVRIAVPSIDGLAVLESALRSVLG
jgi:histidinol-phosphate/aromatic aminotransferase/cobyric acid decarboxylase-like protein